MAVLEMGAKSWGGEAAKVLTCSFSSWLLNIFIPVIQMEIDLQSSLKEAEGRVREPKGSNSERSHSLELLLRGERGNLASCVQEPICLCLPLVSSFLH